MIKKFLTEKGYSVEDFGTSSDESVDYTDHIFPVAEKIMSGGCDLGVGICYTGIGSSIAANKVKGVRASLCHSPEEAKLTRAHNDSNMLIIGAGFLKKEAILPIVESWINTSFEGGRHERRVNKIKEYESQHGA